MLFGFDDATAEPSAELPTEGEAETIVETQVQGTAWRGWLVSLVGLLACIAIGLAAWALLSSRNQTMTQTDLDQAVADALDAATPAELSAGEVFNQIAPSFVVVRAVGQDSAAPATIGAGIVINESGQVLTAHHVIAGATSLELGFTDGTTTTATVESENPAFDIAVLNPVGGAGVRVPAVLGNPRTLAIGDTIYAMGNPLGLTGSISSGVISGLDRDIPTPFEDDTVFENLIQFDAAVNQGSSGGPLLNANGQVIGIITALADPTGEGVFIGIGFAVPIDIAAVGAANGPAQ